MESLELKDVLTFKQTDFKGDEKRKKRLKLGKILVLIFLAIGLISFLKGINFSLDFSLKSEKHIVKPIPDYLIGESEKKLNLKPEKILFLGKKDIEILLPYNLQVFITREKDFKSQLTYLQLIINRFKIEGRGVKKIDLRFKNPIIE